MQNLITHIEETVQSEYNAQAAKLEKEMNDSVAKTMDEGNQKLNALTKKFNDDSDRLGSSLSGRKLEDANNKMYDDYSTKFNAEKSKIEQDVKSITDEFKSKAEELNKHLKDYNDKVADHNDGAHTANATGSELQRRSSFEVKHHQGVAGSAAVGAVIGGAAGAVVGAAASLLSKERKAWKQLVKQEAEAKRKHSSASKIAKIVAAKNKARIDYTKVRNKYAKRGAIAGGVTVGAASAAGAHLMNNERHSATVAAHAAHASAMSRLTSLPDHLQ